MDKNLKTLMKVKNRFKWGFGLTLTEILIVVGILVVLLLIALALSRSQIFKGNDARRKSDLHKISVAVEEYEKDHDCYPLPSLVVCGSTGLQPYIDKIPCDPITNASYYYEHQDAGCPGWFRFYSDLENNSDQDITPGVGPYAAFDYYVESPNAPTVSQSTPQPTASGGGGGGGGGEVFPTDIYGCTGGACVLIMWDPDRPGPECDPNYRSSNCYGQCGPVELECTSWK